MRSAVKLGVQDRHARPRTPKTGKGTYFAIGTDKAEGKGVCLLAAFMRARRFGRQGDKVVPVLSAIRKLLEG